MNIENSNSKYYKKYLKYKTKYLNLNAQLGGGLDDRIMDFLSNSTPKPTATSVGTLEPAAILVGKVKVGSEDRLVSKLGNGDRTLLNNPNTVAFDHEGNLVVTDSSENCIKVFKYKDGVCGDLIKSFGHRLSVQNFVLYKDKIILSTEYSIRVLNYSDGTHIVDIADFSKINGHSGIAVDSDGNILVYVGGNMGCIQVFDNMGKFKRSIYGVSVYGTGTGDGQIHRDSTGNITFDRDGNLVVTDYMNRCVFVLDYKKNASLSISDGTFIRNIVCRDSNIKNPNSTAFDSSGNIIITDNGSKKVYVLRYNDLTSLRTISGDGREFGHPCSIAIDKDGRIAICDLSNNCIEIFE